MKVLYDHQIFSFQNVGGVSRYFFELLRGQTANAELSISYSDNEYLALDSRLRAGVLPKAQVRRPPAWRRLLNRQATRRSVMVERANRDASVSRLRAGDWDVFHPTYYDPYFLDHIGRKPFVLTVHDMIHEIFPEHYPLVDSVSTNKKALAHEAAHIIAVSACTKRDLVSIYGVPEERISVIHHGSSLGSMGATDESPLPPVRYLLMVGMRGGYKNIYFAMRSLVNLLTEMPDLTLVCAGGGAFTEEEIRFLADLGLSARVRHYSVSDARLATLYRHAEALVFPSLYEGFGIPVVEAFSCGCPVVASNTAALKEVAGNAAEYFDPKDPKSICDAVTRVIVASDRRAELVANGKVRLARYSWSECVAKTIDVYKLVSQ
jgi:glycosyltransferase involved in cell wall biosynthesis